MHLPFHAVMDATLKRDYTRSWTHKGLWDGNPAAVPNTRPCSWSQDAIGRSEDNAKVKD